MEELEDKRAAAFGKHFAIRIVLIMIFSIRIAKDSLRNDTIAQLLQRRQEYDERENNRALNEFRALHQQPSAQRN